MSFPRLPKLSNTTKNILWGLGTVAANGTILTYGYQSGQEGRKAYEAMPREKRRELYDACPLNKLGHSGYGAVAAIEEYRLLQDPEFAKKPPLIPFDVAEPIENEKPSVASAPPTSTPPSNAGGGNNPKTELLSSFISGSAAGATVAYATFPAESFKKYVQRRGIGFGQLINYPVMSAHFKAEAFHPFHGSSLFALNIVPTTAVQLTTDAILKRVLPADSGMKTQMAASAFCGVMGALTATPIENYVARMQEMNMKAGGKVSHLSVFTDLTHYSMLRPWKSYPMIATRDGIFTFCMLWAVPTATRMVKEQCGDNKVADLAARVGVSAIGAAVSHPFDTIGTAMQTNHDPVSAWKTATSIMAKSGYRGFLHGLPPRLVLFFTFSNAIPYVQAVTDSYAKKAAESLLGTSEEKQRSGLKK